MKYAPIIIVFLTKKKKKAFDPFLSLVFIIKHKDEKDTITLCTVHRDFSPFKPPKQYQAQANNLITVSAFSVSQVSVKIYA